MRTTRITEGVYQFSGIRGGVWGANVFLLAGEPLALVDTGFKGRAGGILAGIRKLGYAPSDVGYIIITHHHADHIGSLAALQKATGARVAAHPADAPYIEGRLPQPGAVRGFSRAFSLVRPLWTTAPVPVDIPVNDGAVLPVCGGIMVLHTPGHTPGSIALLVPQKRLLMAGDLVNRRFGRLSLPARSFTVDLAREISSVKRVADLDFDIACFGHGQPILHGARAQVAALADSLANAT